MKKTRINSVSNNNIVIGDTITIYGTNFHPLTDYNQVLIGDVNAEVLEISLSYLKIIVPYNIHSGTNDLQINTYGQYAFIADYLKLLTPQIIGITPEDGCREMEISIIGENFSLNKDYNKVILNEDTVEVLRSSRDTIWFKIDNFIEEGIKNVTLKVGNQTKTSSNLYNHTEPWKKLKDYPGKGRLYLVSFSINGKIYMGGGRETIKNNTVVYDFWEYDPTNDIWIKKADIPINGNNGVSFSTTNKGYCLKEKVLWCYDPVNNLWEEKSIFPGQAEYYQFAFVVNDRVFLGHGGYKIYNSYFYSFELWEYKESNNTWARRSDFPIEESSFMGFSVGSSGFMGSLKPGEFWEYDINTDVWKQNTDFSYQERMVSPSIAVATSNKGYVMTGKYSYLDENEIFEFDPVTKWKKRLSMPTQNYRFSLRGTNLNDKIYVGTGRDDDYNYNYYNDFYEYDPSKDIFEEVP